jgi:dTDP-4-dehydrorhamnose reductase
MKILVTGLNGLIGWQVFQKVRMDHTALGTYRRHHPQLLGDSYFRLDLHNQEELKSFLEQFQPDYIIHAWSMCDLDLCEQIPQMAEKVNVHGLQKMLNAIQGLSSLKKFVYISTDHVFCGEQGKYNESDKPVPKHVYGRTKYEAEQRVHGLDIPYLIVRPGLTIGQSLQGNKGPRDFLFARIQARKPIHYFTDEWRSPIHADELAEQVLNLTLSDQTGIFHIAGEQILNRYDLARSLALTHALPVEHIFPRLRAEDRWAHIRPRDLSLRSNRLKNVLSKKFNTELSTVSISPTLLL